MEPIYNFPVNFLHLYTVCVYVHAEEGLLASESPGQHVALSPKFDQQLLANFCLGCWHTLTPRWGLGFACMHPRPSCPHPKAGGTVGHPCQHMRSTRAHMAHTHTHTHTCTPMLYGTWATHAYGLYRGMHTVCIRICIILFFMTQTLIQGGTT